MDSNRQDRKCFEQQQQQATGGDKLSNFAGLCCVHIPASGKAELLTHWLFLVKPRPKHKPYSVCTLVVANSLGLLTAVHEATDQSGKNTRALSYAFTTYPGLPL